MSEREASQLGTLWEGDEEAGREHVTSSYKSPHSCELGVSEQGKKAYSSKTWKFHTAPRHIPLLLEAGFSLCPERAGLASPAPCSSHLQLPPGRQTPSDVAPGRRKLKIKERPVVTANAMLSATHRSAGLITQAAAMSDGQCPGITNGGSCPTHTSLNLPGIRAKQTVPPLIPVQKLVSN